tara:strand:- start:5687 stop:5824 length:138 start_codon:yes stop_codon:yes gene_type:complete
MFKNGDISGDCKDPTRTHCLCEGFVVDTTARASQTNDDDMKITAG